MSRWGDLNSSAMADDISHGLDKAYGDFKYVGDEAVKLHRQVGQEHFRTIRDRLRALEDRYENAHDSIDPLARAVHRSQRHTYLLKDVEAWGHWAGACLHGVRMALEKL